MTDLRGFFMKDELNHFGEQIKDVVDSAISTKDFRDLSRSIGDIINGTIDAVVERPQRTVQKPTQKTVPETPALYTRHPGGQVASIAFLVIGYILMIVSLILVLIFSFLTKYGIDHGYYSYMIPLIIFIILAVAGLILGVKGTRRLTLINRFRLYIRQLGNQMYIPVRAFADRTRKSIPSVNRDLKKMIELGYFYEAHLDEENGYLILSHKSYEEYRKNQENYQARQKILQQQQKAAQLSAECQKLIDEGQNYIKHIHMSNDLIADRVLTEKLNKMEQVVTRIFDEVRVHPEVAPELQKMMNYYLPTTSKLLDAYRDLDSQPIAGTNINSTKREIESAIDTLNVAFEKLLDSLFADRAWDISSDISVLNTMLAQEGLTTSDFKKE